MQPVPLWIILAAFASSMVCLGATAQEPVSSGTLNLVLANKNGFVIAADSRRSSFTGTFPCNGIQQSYCDDSQKLFKTGRSSAMVIAGFAAGQAGTPLDLVVASVLRKRFGPGGNRAARMSSGKMTIEDASQVPGMFEGPAFDSFWTRMALEMALTGVASLYNPARLPERQMDFSAIFAGIDEGKVVLKKQEFQGSWIPSGDRTPVVPNFRVLNSVVTVDGFVHCTAGIKIVADQILAGDYKTTDPVIKRYYSKLHDRPALDAMTVAEMTDLARALLRETAKFSDFVGGPDQIGIFPVNGESQWVSPDLPKELSPSPKFQWQNCLTYVKGAPPTRRSCSKGWFFEDFQHPLDEVIAQFFLASEFNDVSVILDNNYFVRSRFENVTFKYAGAPFLALNGTYINCRVEFSEDAALPRGSEIFDHCEKVKVKTVTLDNGTIGRPLKWEKK